jgi:hypothetical protein
MKTSESGLEFGGKDGKMEVKEIQAFATEKGR